MKSDITKQTEETMAHHVQTMMSGDLEAIVQNFADDATIFTAERTFQGHDQIRIFFEEGMQSLPEGYMAAFEEICRDIHGEIVYLVYKVEPFVALGTDTWVFRNGKIIAQTYAAYWRTQNRDGE
ncbi:MAG: nuclear transport factor 2 family protein [Chloroflexi bacterium]|nr:nuclear transport factor 2 family protein [Chloroflexota bacterium]